MSLKFVNQNAVLSRFPLGCIRKYLILNNPYKFQISISLKLAILLFGIAFSDILGAQDLKLDSLFSIGVCDKEGYCIPNLQGLPRPKGLEISQRRNIDYSIDTKVRDSAQISQEDIRRDKQFEINLRFPIINKSGFKLAGGLRYRIEEFSFEDPAELTDEFQQKLEDKPLRSVRTAFYLVKPLKGNKYLFGRMGFGLNGDFNNGPVDLKSYFKGFAAALYGKKVNRTKTWGVGVSYSYTLGNLGIYPIFAYNKQLDKKFGVELLLPVSAKLRYIPSPKNIFYFENKLEGENYNLEFEGFQDQTLFLGKSNFISFLTYEREIHDFLWFGFSAGYRFNINFDLSRQDEFVNNRDPFIDNRLGVAPFYKVGIFLVPPQKWLKDK